MNVGILGGTFDPVHLGHLSIAESAIEQVSLDRVLFIPAGHPRLKQAEPAASVLARLEMVRLATTDNPRFKVCDLEAHRPGPTYTVDTLAQLTAELGSTSNLFFILGLDVLGQLDRWKDPARVLEMCQMLVSDRPGEQQFDWADFYCRVPEAEGRVLTINAPLIDISATKLRRKVAAGENLAGETPKLVAEYINEQRLYQTTEDERSVS